MAKQTIGLGAAPDDNTGDNLRLAGDKINDNFDELYALLQKASLGINTVDRSVHAHQGGFTTIGDGWQTTLTAQPGFVGDDNMPQGREIETSTTLDTDAFFETSQGGTAPFQFRSITTQALFIGRPKQITGNRVWLGFTDLTGVNHFNGGDVPVANIAAFRSTGGETWKAVVSNGVSTTTVDTAIAVSTTTAQVLRIEWESGGAEVRFYINATLVATITTNLPTQGTNMRYVAGVSNTVGGAGTARSLIVLGIKTRETIFTAI